MKKIYLLTLLLLAILTFSQDDNFTVKNLIQANTNNGGGIDYSVFDNSGNTISIGRASGNFTIEQEHVIPTGLTDLYIYKTNTITKEKVFLSTINAGSTGIIIPIKIFIDQFDDIFIISNFKGKININDNIYESNKLETNYILIKVTSTGETSWSKKVENDYTRNIVSTSDFTYINNFSVIDQYQRNTGELVKKIEMEYYNVTSLKTHNDLLYLSGTTIKTFDVNGFTVVNNYSALVQTDLNLNPTNILTSGNNRSFQDFIINDDKIIFNIHSYETQISLTSNNGISTSFTSAGLNQSKLWIGKCDLEFKSLDWFKANRFSPDSYESNLFLKANGNFYWHHNDLRSINVDGTTHNFSSRNAFVEFDQNGQYVETRNIVNTEIPRRVYSYTNYNDKELISLNTYNSAPASNPRISSTAIFYKESGEQYFYPFTAYNTTGDYGQVRNSGFLQKTNQDNVYNTVNLFGMVPNYLTDNYSVVGRLSLFSKSKHGTSLWKIGLTNYDETNSGYLGLYRYGNRIDQNSKEESIYSCVCFDTSIYVPKPCTWSGTNISSTELKNSVLISKIDPNGYSIWQKRFISQTDSQNSGMHITNIKYDKEDNVWITARGFGKFTYENTTVNLSQSFSDSAFFIIKLDTLGNLMFVKMFEYTNYNNIYIDFDAQNNPIFLFNIYSFSSQFIFDSITLEKIGSSSYQFIFLKLNQEGNIMKIKNLTPNDNGSWGNPHYIIDMKKSNNSFYIYGSTTINKTLENITFTSPYNSNTSLSLIISKMNSDGEIEWSEPIIMNNINNFNSTYRGNFLETDSQSNLYLSLSATDKILYRGQEIQLDKDASENIIIKFDENGNLKNHKNLGTHSSIFNIHINSQDEITLSGNSNQNTIDGQIINNTGGDNYLVFSLEKDILNTSETLKENIKLFPNPTSDFISITTKEKINNIEIYDSTGRKVAIEFNSKNQIDVKKLISGFYYIRITTDKNNLTSKFIKK